MGTVVLYFGITFAIVMTWIAGKVISRLAEYLVNAVFAVIYWAILLITNTIKLLSWTHYAVVVARKPSRKN